MHRIALQLRAPLELAAALAALPLLRTAPRGDGDPVSGERHIDAARFAVLQVRPGVPTPSLFSRSGGGVAWQCSPEAEEGERSDNIEVHASHLGLGVKPMALYANADRLAQAEGRWRRFDHAGRRGVKKLPFRDPRRAPGFVSLFGLD